MSVTQIFVITKAMLKDVMDELWLVQKNSLPKDREMQTVKLILEVPLIFGETKVSRRTF